MAKWLAPWFASLGDRTEIPDDTDPSGYVSFQQGYGPDYERVKTDPLSKNIERDKMNYLFYVITQALNWLQMNGVGDWASASDNDGTAVPYPAGSRVRLTSSGAIYNSAVDNNTGTPGVDPNWVLDGGLVNIQTFTVAGAHIYNKSPGARRVKLTLVGGCGGGGGVAASAAGQTAAAGGGAGGGHAVAIFNADDIDGGSFNLGAGGAGGVGANSGGGGGTSTFGSINATGGSGGAAQTSVAGVAIAGGGVPGVGTGGISGLTGSGGPGGYGFTANVGNCISGTGGATILSQGVAGVASGNFGGLHGSGSGGSGAVSQNGGAAQNGGAGSDGVAIFEEFA